jgi:hypothetical protein
MVIYSRDGRRTGRVKEVRDGFLRVDARFAFDYWLSVHCIAGVRDGVVRLAIDKAQIGAAIVDMDCPQDDLLSLAELLEPARQPRLAYATVE